MTRDWREQAACRDVDDPEIFTVADKDDVNGFSRNQLAKELCAACVVSTYCAELAAKTRATGVIYAGRADHTHTSPSMTDYRDRPCDECGNVYQPLSSNQKFCTRKCTVAADRRRTNENQKAKRRANGVAARVYVDQHADLIRKLAGIGLPDSLIAVRLDCSVGSVAKFRRANGIPAGRTVREVAA